MARIRLICYNKHSKGARALSNSLGAKRIRKDNSNFYAKGTDIIVNWGVVGTLEQMENIHQAETILNVPDTLRDWINKLAFFRQMETLDIANLVPPFSTSIEEAQKWQAQGCAVVARELLSASGGRGIIIVEPGKEIPQVPLYVQYIKKKDEYRAHFFGDKVLDFQRKMKRNDRDDADFRVRNLENGFIYGRENINPPPAVLQVADTIAKVTDLDFGAIDIIYNARADRAYALEINSAPGLEGTTLEVYKRGIRSLLGL